MNKKLMAVAVAGALAAPAIAFAQASSVQIFGRAHVGLDTYQAEGATAGKKADFESRTRVYDTTSRIGFRGTEDLGGGLKAIFLITSGVNIDTGTSNGQNGAPSSSSGTLGSRDSWAGLQGRWGQLTFGRHNVWWGNGTQDQIFANQLNASTGISTGSFGRGMGVGVTRVSNSVQYNSPVMSGFNAVVSYSPGTQEAAPAGASANGELWGLTLQGTWGAFAGGWDYVRTEKNSVGGVQPQTTGNKLRFGWTYRPGGMISIIAVRSKQEDGGSNFIAGPTAGPGGGGLVDLTVSSLEQDAFVVTWEHLLGNWQFIAQAGKVDDIDGCRLSSTCNNTGSKNYLAAVRYLFSKRTAVYLSYISMRNESNYNMDFSTLTATPGGLGVASVGADPRTVSLGILHNF